MNKIFLSIFLFLFSFGIYIATLTPAVYWEDSAEFSATTYLLAISHQPGYPLYHILGKLFTYLPIGNITLRLNLFSSFCASLCSMLLFFIFIQVFNVLKYNLKSVAFISTMIFIFSYTFWEWSTYAGVYTLFIFFVLCLILIFLFLKDNPRSYNLLYLFFFIVGLSITHHLLVLLPGSAFLFFLIVYQTNIFLDYRRFLIFLFLFFLPLFLYIYLPFRSAVNFDVDWGNPENLSQFINTISIRAQAQDITDMPELLKGIIEKGWYFQRTIYYFTFVIFLTPIFAGFLVISKYLAENIKKYIYYGILSFILICFIFSYGFITQFVPFFEKVQGFHNAIFIEFLDRDFPVYLLWIAILGVILLHQKDKTLLLFFLLLFFTTNVFIIFKLFPQYRPYTHYKFFLIGNIVISIFIGVGLLNIKLLLDKFVKFKTVVIVIFIITLSYFFLSNYKKVNRGSYHFAEDYTENILRSIDDNSIILVEGIDPFFLLQYYLYVEKPGKKVNLIYLDGVGTPWYFEKLKEKKLINLKLKNKKDKDIIIKNLIASNLKKYKIYYMAVSSPSPALQKFCLKPRGIVFLISKNNKECRYSKEDIKIHKNHIYNIYKYRGVYSNSNLKDRKAKGIVYIYADAHRILGIMYLRGDKINKAMHELKKSIRLNPNNSSVYEILSSIYRSKGNIKLAAENMRKAVEYDKGNVYLMNRLGMLYLDIGDFEKAITEFKNALKIYPGFAEGYYNLGMAYKMQGRIEEALNEFQVCKKISPKLEEVYFIIGIIYFEQSKYKKSENEFKKLLQINPENAQAKFYLEKIEELK